MFVWSCAAAAVVWAAVGPAGQTLADTARATAAKREGEPHVKLTGKDLPAVDGFEMELRQVVLTDDRFWKYVRTRRLLLDMRLRDTPTDKALLTAERDARNPLAVEHALINNVRTIAVLDRERMPAREYVLVETAFHRALEDASLSEERILLLPANRVANANYIRQQDEHIKGMLEFQWRLLEEQLEVMRKVRQ